jgi:hypothetical protein
MVTVGLGFGAPQKAPDRWSARIEFDKILPKEKLAGVTRLIASVSLGSQATGGIA